MTPAVDVVSTEASTRHKRHQNPQKNSDTFFHMLEKNIPRFKTRLCEKTINGIMLLNPHFTFSSVYYVSK